MQVSSPNTIIDATFVLDYVVSSFAYVNQITTAKLTFKIVTPVNKADFSLEITFPNDLTINQAGFSVFGSSACYIGLFIFPTF